MSDRRVVIVGASAAGLRCAARLRRLQPSWTITVVEKSAVFSYAACGLPYALSGDVTSAVELRQTADGSLRDTEFFAAVKGLEVKADQEAVAIDAAAGTLTLRSGEQLGWDELVLATGAQPKRLPGQPAHPRVHTFHTHEDLSPLLESLQRGQLRSVIIVGAGLCGCELAEAFAATWGAEVTLIEAEDHLLPMILDPEVASLVRGAMTRNEVKVMSGQRVAHLEADDAGVTVVAGGDQHRADAVIVALGAQPAVALAQAAGARLGETGAILVDDRLATSVPHIWAAGDCIEVPHAVSGRPCHLPLGSLANRQGRLLADILAGAKTTLPAAAGACGLKVFDLNVAAVGLTLAQAKRLGLAARAAWWCGHDRAHYYPEAKEIALQLVYEAGRGRLLGVQAAGAGEVHKRIDVATSFVQRHASLADLAALEHAYSPPYAPALEPLAVLGMVAQNQEAGLQAVSPLTPLDGLRLLDVRHDQEREARPSGGAEVIALPQRELRGRLGELSGEYLVVCERGTRSAEVARLLGTRGHACRFLGGGLRWRGLAAGDEEVS